MDYTLSELNQIRAMLRSNEEDLIILAISFLKESDYYKSIPLDDIVMGYNRRNGILKADLYDEDIIHHIKGRTRGGACIMTYFFGVCAKMIKKKQIERDAETTISTRA